MNAVKTEETGADQARLRIHAAAIECVERWGIEKTTLNDIARLAGCSRQTVYNYFPGKAAVLESALEEAGRKFMERLEHLALQFEDPADSLNRTSYRAGLWDAARFANQQWAEGCRRGLEKAKRVVCVNDGAPWIWLIVAMCYAPRCVEILDWWHAVQKVWELAFALLGQDNKQSQDWAEEQKSLVWAGNLRQIFRGLRLLCPRGELLPDKVRLGIGYLFRHRWRMRYPEFRQAGCPIGSGTVESACKVVMQERMKQAGMRWSRTGAQAMLALRSVLLSERWEEVWPSLEPPPKLA